MGLNEDLIELSDILTDEQLIEYLIRLTSAENQFLKNIEGISLSRHRNYLLNTHSKRLKRHGRQRYRPWRSYRIVLGQNPPHM
jgi:hypothetical protein